MIGERIKKLRKALGLTQKEFGEHIGVKPNTIGTYEIERSEPIDAVVSLICREFNVNETWLRTGEGEMFVQRTKEDELAAAVERLITGQSPEFKRRLIIALSSLKEEHWHLLEEKLKEIVGVQEAAPARTDDNIDQKVEDYRRRLMLEKNPEDASSLSNGDGTETA